MAQNQKRLIEELTINLTKIISETNGLSLQDTLELATHSMLIKENPEGHKLIQNFQTLLSLYQQDGAEIETLLGHPVSQALFNFFLHFPKKYHEEHIHLTGSLTAEFIFPRLQKILKGPNKKAVEKKITDTYGPDALPIRSVADVESLIRLKDEELFGRYLKILLLPKLILTSKQAHVEAAYHMAFELYTKYNVGKIRLKYSFSRESSKDEDVIPGIEKLTPEHVTMGLYEGFMRFKNEHPDFDFVLSPSFRKENHFFDAKRFSNKKDHFLEQVDTILKLIKKYPQLAEKMNDVDTVGDERELYKKDHFSQMRLGFRKLQFNGFQIRSHHGETWHTLKKGVQAVDNSMNIWHIDTLEHGLSLGINPNYYFHMLFERCMAKNKAGQGIEKNTTDYNEINELFWEQNTIVKDKIIQGKKLKKEDINNFIKAKFHTAREVEHYQHDILNRMINKKVGLIALPSSNKKLTSCFPDFKDHPFSWWEKKGLQLGVGTDNYITLSTNYIKEMLILLYTDAQNLKITKLLMVVTRENRRPHLCHLLWQMRELNFKID